MEEQRERILERVLPNGDVHIGPVEGFIPKGEVNYERVDGTIFGEEWERYTISGKGKFIWASGSIYEGDFYSSSLHGFGILNGVDGSIYEGSWRMNVRHGLGKNIFPNLDIFEGSWREGMPDGFGRYAWSNGNLYIGNWKSGKMHGRGIMKWENGDVYDGFWLDGVKHGMGCHRFADGSYFLGTWSGGLKDGHGVFYPSGSGQPYLDSWYDSLTWTLTSFEGQLISSIRGRKLRSGGSISRKWPMREFLKYSGRISNRNPVDSCDQPQVNTGRYSSSLEGCMPVYEQEYAQGMLIMENVKLSKCGLPDRIYKMFRSKDVIHPCKTIIMGDKSYYLMLNLQLGIRYTVGKITPVPMREVRSSDFGPRARIKMFFPRSGSQSTPSHCSSEFFWEDYCPMVFRNLREMFRLDAADYMMSICAGDSLKELSSPGKSGSIFYLSQDERFVIKTLRQSELKVLLKMLPDYYNHVRTYENTLITKFFGLHRITLNSRRVRFVVMGNMFRTELRIHRRYDLKGSSHGRSTDPHRIDGNTTLKDLDLPYVFYLEKSWHDSLFKQIILDCMFLKSQHIIDYSLLLGIHFRAPENLKSLGVLQDSAQSCNPALKPDTSLPSKSLLLVTHEPNSLSATPGLHVRGSTLRASSVGNEEVDLLLPDAGRLRVQLGVNMPARADWNRQGVDHSESTVEFCLGGVYDVVLYFGIIDILQDFNMKKKIEHGLKSFRFDPMTISSVEPNLYAKRFISFLERVFQEMKH